MAAAKAARILALAVAGLVLAGAVVAWRGAGRCPSEAASVLDGSFWRAVLGCEAYAVADAASYLNNPVAAAVRPDAGLPPPVPGAPQPSKVMLDGRAATARPLGEIVTRSGVWRLALLGQVGDVTAYQMTRAGAGGTRVLLMRAAATLEAGDTAQKPPVTIRVRIGDDTKVALVYPGAVRVVEDQPLVAFHPDWVRSAVGTRVPAYRRERSWVGTAPPPLPSARLAPYDPSVLSGDATRNFVGDTSPEGGEHTASRGFLHNADATVVDAVLHGEAVDAAMLARFSWESLAQPQGGQWSPRWHQLVDPQWPQPGARPYEVRVGGAPVTAAIDSLPIAAGWARDTAHLENTCFVHWIGTEDPVAGLCVQRQLAFALAEFLEYKRVAAWIAAGRYGGYASQERGVYNTLSALWKSRDVARRAKGRVLLWDAARVGQMAQDVIAGYDAQLFQPVMQAKPGTRAYAAKLFGYGGGELFSEALPDGRQVWMASDYFLGQFGKEPLWLWTRDGNPTVRRWFGMAARQIVQRQTLLGGARGTDSCGGAGGSSVPVTPEFPVIASVTQWSDWANRLCGDAPSDSFNGTWIHTATQAEGLLLLAQDAGFDVKAGLDAMARAKARTNLKPGVDPRQAIVGPALDMPKHWATPR